MRQRVAATMSVASVLVFLGGCGDGSRAEGGGTALAQADAGDTAYTAPDSSMRPANPDDDTGPSGAMSPFGEALQIDCPRSFDIPARAADAPVDDIRGLRLGVSGETAILFAQCADGRPRDSVYMEDSTMFRRTSGTGGLDIRTGATVAVGEFPDIWRRVDYMDIDPADALEEVDGVWHFVMDGMPGREVLYGMWLQQSFEEGAQPTIESQVAALTAKYGEPQYTNRHGELFWAQTPEGEPVPAYDRSLLDQCAGSVSPSDYSLNYGPDCGTVVSAEVRPAQNPLLARSVSVGIFNPSALFNYQTYEFEAERDATLAGEAARTASQTAGADL